MESPSPQKPASLPEIPGYRLEAIIGRGSTGTVYRAVQIAVDRRVALKILHPELAARGRAIRRLQREARTTAKLSHPGIVSAIDMGHIGTLWWYAMELVEGPSLAAKLRKEGKLSERDALRLFIPLCEALEHAFDHGVVHRDLKPGNILIDSGGRARIVDLGLAFAEDDPALTNHGGTLGTPHYISPEQARDPKSADVRSDIWSLGATMFHAVCGAPPFAGDSVAEILSGVLYAPTPDPTADAPNLSRGLQLVLRKCLARDPAKRYQSPRELREDLEALRERRAVSVKRSMLDPVAGEAERRRKRAMYAAAAVVVLALAGGWAWRNASQPGAAQEGASEAQNFTALDEIAQRLEQDPSDVAGAVAELESLQGAIPRSHSARAQAMYASLRQRYTASVQAAHSAFLREFNRLRIDERDLVGALELVARGFPNRLVDELKLSPRQLAEQRALLGLDALRGELEREIERRVGEVAARLRRVHAEEHVQPAAEAEASGEWRRADELLDVDTAKLITRAELSTAGLPAEQLARSLAQLQREVIDRARSDLHARWSADDVEREQELRALERQLWAELKLRKVTSAAAKLRERWNEIVARDSLRPEQMLVEVSDLAGATLARAERELAQTEAENDRADAELALRDFLPRVEREFAAREFARASEAIETQLESRTMRPVLAHLEALLAEARVLEALVQRAAAEVERLGESRESTRLWAGIEREGHIEQGRLPLDSGFRFAPSDGGPARLMALRPLEGKRFDLVTRHDLERLAGLPPGSEDPDVRFQQALLRERLGDLPAALELWPLAEPAEEAWKPLSAALNERLDRARSRLSKELDERRRKASELLFLVRRAAQHNETATTQRQLEQIDALLRDYADLDEVKTDSAWLRQRRDELQRGPGSVDADAFRAAFGPNAIELGDSRRVSMRFVFDADYDGEFARNSWSAQTRGWIAGRNFGLEDLSNLALWPTLVLRQPLDAAQALELELVFEQPIEAGPPRMLAVSLAGVHVVLLGATDAGASARFAIATGPDSGLTELLANAPSRSRAVGVAFKGLQKGARHQLRIELRPGRGKVEVALDGERLDTRSAQRPDPSPSINERLLVVRCYERVRLLEATLRGSY